MKGLVDAMEAAGLLKGSQRFGHLAALCIGHVRQSSLFEEP
jgi:hypothetical protein